MRHITVVDYDPLWEELFEKEKAVINKILGENCLEIYHIGSTAVPGLVAKPIIDIMPVVKKLDLVDSVAFEFEKIGYEYLGEHGIKGRRFLRKGGDERTHHLHIFSVSSGYEIERHLAVRDYLREHKEKCGEYAEIKIKLAEQYPYDNNGYCDGKEDFMKQLEKEALEWRQNNDQKI